MKIKKKHLRSIHMMVFIAAIVIFLFVLAYKTHYNLSKNNNISLSKELDILSREKMLVREPAVAGTFYPGSKQALSSMIAELMGNVKVEVNGKVKALIVPHAGYIYSGEVAAAGFTLLKDQHIDTVILLGPSHTTNYRGASITGKTHYKTPLGLVEISDSSEKIKEDLGELFVDDERIHESEHSIEVEIPFLQSVLDDFKIIPIVIGPASGYEDLVAIGEVVKKYMDDSTVVVVSTDFTHYGPRYGYVPFNQNIEENLKALDSEAIKYIIDKDPEGFFDFYRRTGCTICGRWPVIILLNALGDEKAEFIAYDTSGRMTNDFTNSVSYATITFFEPESLTEEEQSFLLELARDTVESYVMDGRVPEVDESKLTDKLMEVKGCFVTLTKNHNLRGCIGHILPQTELYMCVIENAVSAASRDMRFAPVTAEELDQLSVEISVLSVPEKLEYDGWEDLVEKLIPMTHGVILRYMGRSATYLPQVWANFRSKDEFLSSLCAKGGLPKDCWMDDPEIFTYTAFVFEEE